jgi:hypothetical protein
MTRGTSYMQDPVVRGRQASSFGRLVAYPPEVRESRSNEIPNPGLAPRSSSPLQWQPPLLPHFRFSSLPLDWMREPAAACRAVSRRLEAGGWEHAPSGGDGGWRRCSARRGWPPPRTERQTLSWAATTTRSASSPLPALPLSGMPVLDIAVALLPYLAFMSVAAAVSARCVDLTCSVPCADAGRAGTT